MFDNTGLNFLIFFILLWIVIGIGSVLLVLKETKPFKSLGRYIREHFRKDDRRHS
jgi:hypothetical protein